MKKRLLFVSLFLISILFISSCAEMAPGRFDKYDSQKLGTRLPDDNEYVTALTKQDVLDMLNSCEVEHTLITVSEFTGSCDDLCGDKTCVSGLFKEVLPAEDGVSYNSESVDCEINIGDTSAPYDYLYCTCCSTTGEEPVEEFPPPTMPSLSNGVITCNWEHVEEDVYSCTNPLVSIVDSPYVNMRVEANNLNDGISETNFNGAAYICGTEYSAWDADYIGGSEDSEYISAYRFGFAMSPDSYDSTLHWQVFETGVHNAVNSIQCDFSSGNTIQVYYCCTSDCAGGAYGSSDCNGECTSAQDCKCYGNGCTE